MSAEVAAWFGDATAFDALTSALWAPVSAVAVAEAAPRPGERALDACAGAGASALPLARAVGRGGLVDAVDLSAPLLALAQERAAAEDLPQLRTHVADVMAFGQPGSYDLVVSVMGVFFLPDVDAGGRHLLALLRPGGRLCVSVWAAESMGELLDPLAAVAARERGEPPPDLRRAPAALGTPERLAAWGRSLGAEDVRVGTFPHRVPLTPPLVRAFVDGTAAQALLGGLGAASRERVREELVAALGSGSVLTATSLVLTARRP